MKRRAFLRLLGLSPIAAAVAPLLPASEPYILGLKRTGVMSFTMNFADDATLPWVASGWVHKSDDGFPVSRELGEMIEKLQADKRQPWDIKLF